MLAGWKFDRAPKTSTQREPYMSSDLRHELLLTNIARLATLDPERTGPDNPLGEIPDAAVFILDGCIAWLGSMDEGRSKFPGSPKRDARGGLVTPGWIDSHTHPIFAGD